MRIRLGRYAPPCRPRPRPGMLIMWAVGLNSSIGMLQYAGRAAKRRISRVGLSGIVIANVAGDAATGEMAGGAGRRVVGTPPGWTFAPPYVDHPPLFIHDQ